MFSVAILSLVLVVLTACVVRCHHLIGKSSSRHPVEVSVPQSPTCGSPACGHCKVCFSWLVSSLCIGKETARRVAVKLFRLPDSIEKAGVDPSSTRKKYSTKRIHEDITNVIYMFVQMRRLSLFLMLVAFLLFLPCFVVLREYGGSTHTYTYGWYLSLAFLEGSVQGRVVFALWLALLFSIAFLSLHIERQRIERKLRLSHRHNHKHGASSAHSPAKAASTSGWFYYVVIKAYLVGFILANCIAMIIANGLYIYVTMTQSPEYVAIGKEHA